MQMSSRIFSDSEGSFFQRLEGSFFSDNGGEFSDDWKAKFSLIWKGIFSDRYAPKARRVDKKCTMENRVAYNSTIYKYALHK